ncbi:unnamed protein product [Sphenostylis stenocarpa]|uniref:H15 domain-containing protein n=1 Tax=Sphenostylis stenocarpa TaxID=92480 RepID=A0AA86SCX9_9FABA|nr:unnamed protein product [Sphenostylis stenocarpa]
MDTASTPPPPPTAVPFTVEPNNHVSSPNPNPKHPPYEEMIYTAIGALKEKDGSSKRAIGKYIEQVYKDLPSTHSALLTHHLNRLRSVNLLVMVKKSYKLPGSDPLPASPPSQAQKSRGRPPKPKPLPTTEPVWASLGLSDDPAALSAGDTASQSAKRGPGRPKKIVAVSSGLPVPVRRGRPPGSVGIAKLAKRAGRPPKPRSVSAISSGLKRRGRPPKAQSNLAIIPFAAPVGPDQPSVQPIIPAASVPNGSPRPRGRPRKIVTTGGAPPLSARGRGRPRGVLPLIRAGRLQKLAVGRAKNPARRPVGRPKGSTAAAITAQKADNEDLRKKLEHFQTKVKESLGTLKPYFNHESPVTAIAAIQELEVLSTLDLKAPLRDETQQQPEPLPQTQVYEQQYPPQVSQQPLLQQFFQQHS